MSRYRSSWRPRIGSSCDAMSLHPTAPWGALLAVTGSVLVLALRQGTAAGAVAGLAVALLATAGLGAGAIAPLAVFVLGAGAMTRIGREQKERMGVAERDQGRRGAPHVAAKLALPALAGVGALLSVAPTALLSLVYAGALAGAFADTAATELGPLVRGRVVGVRRLRLRALEHGTPGGMSVTGLLAAAIAATFLAWSARATGILASGAAVWVVAGSGFFATVLESVVTGSAVGLRIGHHGRNVLVSIASAAGALLAQRLGWTGA